ncbi:MAG: hypothetical protein ACRC6I_05300, partial [Paracoccaceae bacterium]
ALAETVLAMIPEHQGHPLQPDLERAYLLALAGSGQFSTAFEMSGDRESVDPLIWSRLADKGSDDDLLTLALAPPAAEIGAATIIADRLAALGFAEAAQSWRAVGTQPAPSARRPSSGTDARTAAAEIPAPAPVSPEQGSQVALERELPAAGQDAQDPARRRELWAQNWPAVAAADGDAWGQLAEQLVVPDTGSALAPLAAAGDLLDQSRATRELIGTLLTETATPKE